MTDSAPQHTSDEVVVRRLLRVMAAFTWLLVLATWPLWMPGGEFPDIPWFTWAVDTPPAWFDWVSLMALGIVLALPFSRWSGPPILRALLVAVAVLLLLTDQHRLQPWALHLLIGATLLTIAPPATALRCLRWFTISIYWHSALSKIDMAFLESQGQWLLEGLTGSLGISTELWSDTTRIVLAGMFPAGELLTAGALLWPRMRRLGLWMAIIMHGLLLLTLGPLGHGQLPGVLLWNVLFVVQDVLLFGTGTGRWGSGEETRFLTGAARVRSRVALVLTGLVCLLPCLSWWGNWDHWPSWSVYSSRPAVVELLVPEEDVLRLPTSLQPFVSPPEPLSDLCRVNLDAWSFETLWCPMYPQERFRVAVAAALGVQHRVSDMRVVVRSSPDRWTAQRQTTVLQGLTAVRQRADRSEVYLLNTKARAHNSGPPGEAEN